MCIRDRVGVGGIPALAGTGGAEAAPTGPTLGLGDLGRGVAQRRADLVDVHLDDRALLAFLGLVGTALEPTRDDDPGAALERFGDVLGRDVYKRQSLILTSNLPFSSWAGVFGDQVVAAAMIDRIVHHADVIALKGASYRLRDRGVDTLPSLSLIHI